MTEKEQKLEKTEESINTQIRNLIEHQNRILEDILYQLRLETKW